MKPTLFFDLDGTLIDSEIGITRCVAHALEALGEPVPDAAALRRWIGPPLRASFMPLLRDAQRVEQAVAHYRERFEDIGWQEHRVYDGIAELIDQLAARGHRLAVVTAKNEPHAERIVSHLPFGHHFESIVGASLDASRGEKTELIAEAMRRLSLSPGDCVMIGDRHMDIDGARAHGMRGLGVLWGFGGEAELRDAGAHALLRHPQELESVLA
ncbi:MAG TPA: HAD hydrolase-like protein [Xanthomonadaceae bacterium]|nr:HAD hydrolase-like protein [Xanthomonadaceae bacterium]